jgi:hypothetical protein
MKKYNKNVLNTTIIGKKKIYFKKYKLDEINYKRQKRIGKKEFDYFTIHDHFDNGWDIFSMTVKDWDFKDWQYQKDHETTVQETYENLYMPGIWFRAIELNDFNKRILIYGQLMSAQLFCENMINEKLGKRIDELIPVIYVRTYGKGIFSIETDDEGVSSLNIGEKRCGGRESESNELYKKLRAFQTEIIKDIQLKLKPYENFTFRIKGEGFDTIEYFLFAGIKAAEEVRYEKFFNDFYEKLQPGELLENLCAEIVNKYFETLKKS